VQFSKTCSLMARRRRLSTPSCRPKPQRYRARAVLGAFGIAYLQPSSTNLMSDETHARKLVALTSAAEQYALAIEHTRIARAPAADPAVIDSIATIGERLIALREPSTISAASALDA
jgi:hypothetical protein